MKNVYMILYFWKSQRIDIFYLQKKFEATGLLILENEFKSYQI